MASCANFAIHLTALCYPPSFIRRRINPATSNAKNSKQQRRNLAEKLITPKNKAKFANIKQGEKDVKKRSKLREFMTKFKKLFHAAKKHILRTRGEGSNHAPSLRGVTRF